MMRLLSTFRRKSASILTGTSVVVLAFTAIMFMTAAVPVWNALNQQVARAAEPGDEDSQAADGGFFQGVVNVDESGDLTQKVNLNDTFFIDVPTVGGFFGSSFGSSGNSNSGAAGSSNSGGSGGGNDSGASNAGTSAPSSSGESYAAQLSPSEDEAYQAGLLEQERENRRVDYWNHVSDAVVAASDALAHVSNALGYVPVDNPQGYPIQLNGDMAGVRERCYYALSQANIYRGAAYQPQGEFPDLDAKAASVQRVWDLNCAAAQLILNTLAKWEAMPASHYQYDVGDPTPYMSEIRSHMVSAHTIGYDYRTLSELEQGRQILNSL